MRVTRLDTLMDLSSLHMKIEGACACLQFIESSSSVCTV